MRFLYYNIKRINFMIKEGIVYKKDLDAKENVLKVPTRQPIISSSMIDGESMSSY